MSATLTPAPPRPPGVAPDDLEALIEEARRRARRRRALYGLAVLLAGGAAAAAFWGSRNGGGGHAVRSGSASLSGPAGSLQTRTAGAPRLAANGPLAIISQGAQSIESVGLGGRSRTLFQCGPRACGELESVAWSPDGKWLAYAAGSVTIPHPQDGLHLLAVASGKSRLIGNLPKDDFVSDLAWSRDGRRIAYVDEGTIYVIQSAHPDQPKALDVARGSSPTWSADGRMIAYGSAPRGKRSSAIYVADLDGSHQRRIAEHGFAPAWSPDGTKIAYSVSCGIRLVTPAAKDVTPSSIWRCAHIGVPGAPVWSPDGTKIAVAAGSDIYVLSAGGGPARIWPASPSSGTLPAWQPLRG